MIVSMKKIFLVVQKKDIDKTLVSLRELGIVHVEHIEETLSESINQVKEKIYSLEHAIEVLESYKDKKENSTSNNAIKLSEPLSKAREVSSLFNSIHNINENIFELKTQILELSYWGNFNPHDIEFLNENGIHVKLVELNRGEKNKLPGEVFVKTVNISSGLERCIIIYHKGEEISEIKFKEFEWPECSLNELIELKNNNEQKVLAIKSQIKENIIYQNALKEYLENLYEDLELEQASAGMGKTEELSYIKGFIPFNLVETLKSASKDNAWGLVISEVTETDQVPTLVKMPKWTLAIKPIFQLMNVIPGYTEKDTSPLFFIFFSIFAGMLIGDAAYGIIFMLIALFVNIKTKGKFANKPLLYLAYSVGFTTFVFGFLSSTFFGQLWYDKFSAPLLPWLRDNNNVMLLCFIIGAVHLSLAHLWKAIIKFPKISFIGEIGMVSLLWGIFFFIRLLILNIPMPAYANILLITGAFALLFFVEMSKNIFLIILLWIANLYNSFMGAFADVISYIRLFAVGVSSLAVADAFNKMVDDIGFGSYFIVSVIILILGHSLNLVLCLIGVLVHGVRLNILEFSNHMGMEWKGVAFAPFKRKQNEFIIK